MNIIGLSTASISTRYLSSLLCVVAVAAGVALLSALFLLSQSVEKGLLRNAEGIDVVIGAKGSPLQLVLSSVYQTDVPTGNIEMAEAERLSHHPQVEKAIPLALGDNYRGYRIVGTTKDYMTLYGAEMAAGDVFKSPFDAVAGAATGLVVGDSFAGAHGLSADSDDIHHYHDYKITGVLKPTGTVLDRLILTSVESVQELHRHPDAGDEDAAEDLKVAHQVTALLVKVRNPLAVINLPREINRDSALQAANPAYEITRLATNIGLGRQTLVTVAGVFVLLSVLMLMSSLASGLVMRRYDLGVMRVMGASPLTIAGTVVAEAVTLATAGAVIGVIAGHGLAILIIANVDAAKGIVPLSSLLRIGAVDAVLVLSGIAAGFIAAILPAVTAARMDIAELLAKGRVS